MPNNNFEIDMAGLSTANRNAVRAPEANEMLERTPGWLLRWGLLSVMLVFGIMILISVLIKYPDALEGSAVITTSPFPAKLAPLSAGRISRLFFKDTDPVQKNSPIAELENTTGYDTVLKFEHRLSQLQQCLQSQGGDVPDALITPVSASPGVLQTLYNNLLQLLYEQKHTKKSSPAKQLPETDRTLNTAISEAQQSLTDYIQTWRKRYLLTAPYTGTLQYLRPVQSGEPAAAGEDLFMVIPGNHSRIALVTLPAAGIGKIKPGQKVHLLLDNFPYNEFGFLEGSVIKRSAVPETPKGGEGRPPAYKVYVKLPDRLVTSFSNTVTFSPEMTATARIITKDRNLAERLAAGVTGLNK